MVKITNSNKLLHLLRAHFVPSIVLDRFQAFKSEYIRHNPWPKFYEGKNEPILKIL